MPVTRHDLRRIGLIGGECSGKSTLARALAEELPACLVTEGLRDFVQREGRPPLAGEQAAVMRAQVAREEDRARGCPQPWLVADPAPLMTAVYSLVYFGDATLVATAADHAAGYDLVVWCAPDFPWVPDPGQRDGAAQREKAEAVISRIVDDELRPRGITVVRATGPVDERVRAVRRAWQP